MQNKNILVHASHLSFSYDIGARKVLALASVECKIYKGDWLAIVGHNGSGKSTLASIFSGLNRPEDNGMLPVFEPRTQMVFQNPESQLVGDTLYEDICFGMENFCIPANEMEERAQIALKQCGLNFSLATPVSNLSGGQKQLLAIAGCLAVDASLLVFDEATSMLDPLIRFQILSVLKKLHSQGKTIVWVTQLLEELAYAQRVIALMDGTIDYDGCVREFFYPKADPLSESPCERMGFKLPYAVQVAKALYRKGLPLVNPPISSFALNETVRSIWL